MKKRLLGIMLCVLLCACARAPIQAARQAAPDSLLLDPGEEATISCQDVDSPCLPATRVAEAESVVLMTDKQIVMCDCRPPYTGPLTRPEIWHPESGVVLYSNDLAVAWSGVGGESITYTLRLAESDDTYVDYSFGALPLAAAEGSWTAILTDVVPSVYDLIIRAEMETRVSEWSEAVRVTIE